MLQFENVLKSIVTTVLGAVIMGFAFYGWYTEWLTDWQAGGSGMIGFALLFMRDKLPEFIGQFFTVLLDKFKGGSK